MIFTRTYTSKIINHSFRYVRNSFQFYSIEQIFSNLICCFLARFPSEAHQRGSGNTSGYNNVNIRHNLEGNKNIHSKYGNVKLSILAEVVENKQKSQFWSQYNQICRFSNSVSFKISSWQKRSSWYVMNYLNFYINRNLYF